MSCPKLNLCLKNSIELRYCDPINSLYLEDDKVIFGTMMGRIVIHYIIDDKTHILADLSNENISGCSYFNNNFYVSVGDEFTEIISVNNNKNNFNICKVFTYDQIEVHKENCERAFTLLDGNNLLLLSLNIPEKNEDLIIEYDCEYNLITYNEKEKISEEEGFIKLTSYMVPFDFRFSIFLFLEHTSHSTRTISIYDFSKKNKSLFLRLSSEFGQVSFLRLMSKELVLLVKNEKIIEIYNIQNAFELVGLYLSKSEVLAVGLFETEKDVFGIAILEQEFRISEFTFFNKGINKYEIFHYLTIDLKNLDGLGNNLLDRGLFTLDFPYYIALNEYYYVLSTDQACLVIQKFEKDNSENNETAKVHSNSTSNNILNCISNSNNNTDNKFISDNDNIYNSPYKNNKSININFNKNNVFKESKDNVKYTYISDLPKIQSNDDIDSKEPINENDIKIKINNK